MNALIPIFVVRDALQSTELGNTALTNPPEDRSFAEIAVASFILGVKNTPTPAFDFLTQTLEGPPASEFESSIARGTQFCA